MHAFATNSHQISYLFTAGYTIYASMCPCMCFTSGVHVTVWTNQQVNRNVKRCRDGMTKVCKQGRDDIIVRLTPVFPYWQILGVAIVWNEAIVPMQALVYDGRWEWGMI